MDEIKLHKQYNSLPRRETSCRQNVKDGQSESEGGNGLQNVGQPLGEDL
jgi:hypothetical protein